MNFTGFFKLESISKSRRDRWLFKLLQYRGILDVIIFAIVLLLRWFGVDNYFKDNLFGDLCVRGAAEDKIRFCEEFIETAITVRLAAGACLTIGGYFVSTFCTLGARG